MVEVDRLKRKPLFGDLAVEWTEKSVEKSVQESVQISVEEQVEQ